MTKFHIQIISLVTSLNFCTPGNAQDLSSIDKSSWLKLAKSDEKGGSILSEEDIEENASTDTPYYYTYQYFSPDDFTPTLRSGLQSIGFSFDPMEDDQRREVNKCEQSEGELEWNVFWTDWVIINPNLMKALKIDASDFEVALVEPHEYRIQIYGCYRGGTQIEYRQLPRDRCQYGYFPQMPGPNAEALIKVDVQHRGSGGTWRDFDNQAFDTQPITVSVNDAIQEILERTEPEPRIVLSNPGCI